MSKSFHHSIIQEEKIAKRRAELWEERDKKVGKMVSKANAKAKHY